ncbi:uncharacterized protein LOC123307015 [Coccinella septempunctata]|uniref:uncharacterized protein LOC123307015 n=1 Tax=Coccinella septempunctata TaxID=41139 RepID=UPI001D08B0A5|nr:uncharacterized protein LOC123307015 [Coccinella septempunctata]
MATWNVQGINKKLEDVIKGLEHMKVDIAVLTETKKKGNGIEHISNYVHIYSGVPKNERASKGVSILINKKFIGKIHNWNTINERILSANLTIKGHRTTIVGVYGPNDDSNQKEKDDFYTTLDNTLTALGNQREIVVLGDLNARVGRKNGSKIVGIHGEETLNDSGRRLLESCEEHKMRILNGFYSHRDIHKYTWHQETRGLKSIIDYIILKQDTKWQTKDIRVYRGIECGSDHFLLISKIYIAYNTDRQTTEDNIRETKTNQNKYNLVSLNEPSTRTLFQQRLDQKLSDQYLTMETTHLYEHVMESLHSAAYEALGKESQPHTKNYNITWNSVLEQQKHIKQAAYNKWMSTKNISDHITYRREQNKYKDLITKNKNETWERKCSEVNSYMGGTRSTVAWNLIRSLRKDTSHKTNLQPIPIDKWKEHYARELREDRQPYLANSPIRCSVQGETVNINEDLIKKVLKSMKNRKAPGPEELPAELLKNGSNKLIKFLTELMNRYINGEPIPSTWKEAWITPIHKKGKRDDCSNYRCISVTNDQVVVAQDKEDLEFMATRLFAEYEKWGLSVNKTKTKYLCIGQKADSLHLEDNIEIGTCSEYTYLGAQIDHTGRTETEIGLRILKGRRVIGCLNSILWSKNISREKKHQIYNSIFEGIVLYGCETWQLTKGVERRLLALEMDFWRRSAGKSKMDKVRNETIRNIMQVERTIIDEIQRRQLIWYGHVERMCDERLPKMILKWTPPERRKRGRPKKTWFEGIEKAMSERNLHPGDWQDKKAWRLGTGRRRTL